MIAWEAISTAMAQNYLNQHMAQSHQHAMTGGYQDRTGESRADLYHDTYREGTSIIGDVGYMSAPDREGSHGVWLENMFGNVHAYGNPSRPFGQKYAIIEKARSHNLPVLIAKLRALFGPGGFGISRGGRGSVF
jgi:hypothetical protein